MLTMILTYAVITYVATAWSTMPGQVSFAAWVRAGEPAWWSPSVLAVALWTMSPVWFWAWLLMLPPRDSRVIRAVSWFGHHILGTPFLKDVQHGSR